VVGGSKNIRYRQITRNENHGDGENGQFIDHSDLKLTYNAGHATWLYMKRVPLLHLYECN